VGESGRERQNRHSEPYLFPWSLRPPVLEDRIRFSLGPYEDKKMDLCRVLG
jgi:hypothetical protein